ncbi:MAG: UvrD-helicase domain-containing protein, partial [Bellilinea sp.]
MFNPRPKQQEVLAYTGGFMGVSAVPGSGKTHTLSRLAADLIASDALADDQEILVVTLVNSAVDNFSSRIAAFMKEYGLLPELGYRIRTLHGLAHDIVRERPELAGLSDRFTIVDERETNEILGNAVRGWLRSHPDFYDTWTDPETNLDANPHLYQKWEEGLISLAGNFISQAKDLQATPQILTDSLDKAKIRHPLLDFGLDIYISYQQALAYRSAVDFSDLIRLALKVLQSDPEFLTRLRRRWPYILEDEAQDSSLLQEEILSLLAGDGGNWVRVGDPNQAIYETFTTASPE